MIMKLKNRIENMRAADYSFYEVSRLNITLPQKGDISKALSYLFF